MEMKICSKCKRELPVNMFSKHKGNKDGYRGQCTECQKTYQKKYDKEHIDKEKTSKYYKDNRIKLLEIANEYYKNNKEKSNKYSVLYAKTHKEKVSAHGLKYRMGNRDKLNAASKERYNGLSTEFKKQYYESNKETMLIRLKKYRKDNKEYFSKYNKEWNKNNKDKVNIVIQRRRAVKMSLPHTLTIGQWRSTVSHFDNCCAYCGKPLPLVQEHFLALSNGGGYVVNNIIPSCKSCNSKKNTRDFSIWYPKYEHYSKEREVKILKFLNYKNNNQQLTLTL